MDEEKRLAKAAYELEAIKIVMQEKQQAYREALQNYATKEDKKGNK